MKKYQTVLLSAFTVTLFAFTASAQHGQVRMTAGIAGAKPIGDFTQLVDKTNLRGADISIMYGLNDKLGVGLNIGFQDFYEKFPRAIYKLSDGSDISAVVTNSVQVIPFLATATYYLNRGNVQPYVSAGAGGAMVINSQYLGESANDFDKVKFAVRPTAGIFIPFKKQGEVGLNLAAGYTYIPYKYNKMTSLSYLGFTIGIGFPMRN